MAQGAESMAISAGSSPAAERMRRHRQRRRNRLRCVMVELRETEIDALVSTGLLKAETRNDLSAVRKALYAHHERTLGNFSCIGNRHAPSVVAV